MGGQNHQPCRDYLENSTKLSRAVSVAMACLETANVELENALLQDLCSGTTNIEGVVKSLVDSEGALVDAFRQIASLRKRMDENSYQDLPSLQRLDLDLLRECFSADRMIDGDSWRVIAGIMQAGGFYAVLDHFEAHVSELAKLTSALRFQIQRLRQAAVRGELNFILEENRPGNIKKLFARLYTAWSVFKGEFLASSMLSTELWYAFNGYGSLAEKNKAVHAA